jgi:hypothetical protein
MGKWSLTMNQTIQKKIKGINIEENKEFYLELLKQKRERNDKFYNEFKNIFSIIASYFWVTMKIIGIALVCGFVGLGSVEPIYLMNKAFGMGYATFASYAESGLVGAILALSLFKFTKDKK